MAGSVIKRGEKSWRLKYDAGRDPVTKKRRTRFVTFKGTKREAELKLAALITEYTSGASVDPSKITVSEFLVRWQSDFAAVHVTPKTAERYGQLIRRQIVPHIGQQLLQKLRPVHLTELYAKLLKEGLAPRTVGHVHRLLHRALGHAGTWGVAQQNVASLVQPPKVETSEVVILTKEQIAKLFHHIKRQSMFPILSLALATGARRGELLALRIKDFDVEKRTLRIERSLEQTKAGLRFKPPKTKHGKRTISLPPSIVTQLRAHLMKVRERRLLLGMGKDTPEDLLFPRWDGQVRSPNWLSQKFRLAMNELGIKGVTVHSLRHTHASHLIASGMDVLTISRRLGHGSPAITLTVYGHLIEGKDAQAAEVMEATLAFLQTE
jgi:integrase